MTDAPPRYKKWPESFKDINFLTTQIKRGEILDCFGGVTRASYMQLIN